MLAILTDRGYFVILECSFETKSFRNVFSYSIPPTVGCEFLEVAPNGSMILIGMHIGYYKFVGGFHKQYCVLTLTTQCSYTSEVTGIQFNQIVISPKESCLYYGMALLQNDGHYFAVILQQQYNSSNRKIMIYSVDFQFQNFVHKCEIPTLSTAYRVITCMLAFVT